MQATADQFSGRGVSEVEADLEALLGEMAAATDGGDEIADRLLARWEDLNREYDAVVRAALDADRESA